MREHQAIVLLLAAAVLAAFGQTTDAQRGRRPRLPGALGKVERSQYGRLNELLDEAMRALEGKGPLAPEVVPGNFFGRIVLDSDDDEPPVEPEEFGLFVLGGLNSSQIRLLSDFARSQLTEVQKIQLKHRTLQKKLVELRGMDRPSRTFERELTTIGKELGELEAAMGLAQANAFIDLKATLTGVQFEYMMLLRRTPNAASADNPAVVKLRASADKLSAAHRKLVMTLAERACLYLTGTAATNLPTIGNQLPKSDSDEAVRKADFLKQLNVAQLAHLAGVLSAEVRVANESSAKRMQVAVLLDGLKVNKQVDSRRVALFGGQMGEFLAKVELIEFGGIAQFNASFTDAKRAFILNNILIGER